MSSKDSFMYEVSQIRAGVFAPLLEYLTEEQQKTLNGIVSDSYYEEHETAEEEFMLDLGKYLAIGYRNKMLKEAYEREVSKDLEF